MILALRNQLKLTLSGYCNRTQRVENFELKGEEKKSFMNILNGKSDKIVRLERILGLGGEGIVLSDKITTKEYYYEKRWWKRWIHPLWMEKEKGREVAVKFVKFEKEENEDLGGPEEKEEDGFYGGIDENGEWVTSQYFARLYMLGDYAAATWRYGGYSRPYIDFGVSKIYDGYFYVIGELKV